MRKYTAIGKTERDTLYQLTDQTQFFYCKKNLKLSISSFILREMLIFAVYYYT